MLFRKRWGTLALAVLAVLVLALALGEASPVAAQPRHTATVEVRVWQNIADQENLYISARSAGGSWAELGTTPLHLRGTDERLDYRYGVITLPVTLSGAAPNHVANVEVRVWPRFAGEGQLYISAGAVDAFGPGLTGALLDMSGLSRFGRYRYGDITLAVPSTDAPDDPVEIVFWGAISEAERTQIRERTAAIIAFWDARYGLRVPGLELHVGADVAALAEAALETGQEKGGFTQYRNGFLFVPIDDSSYAIEHLYFHAIQDYLAQGRYWGPWWLGEGAAEYATSVYWDVRGDSTLAGAIDADRRVASYAPMRLEELEAGSPVGPESFGLVTEALAAFAVAWLVEQAGDDSLIAYYRELPRSEGWTEAFERAFGLPFFDVYPAFAAYRADVVVVRREVKGVVLGPDGEPVEDWRIDIDAYREGAQRWSDFWENSASEGFNGDFTSRLPDGTYTLTLSTQCGSRHWVDLGWYGGESGFTTRYADVKYVVVEGEDVEGIVIRLPALPDEMFPDQCSYGPRATVSGVIVGFDGEPTSNVFLQSYDPVAEIYPDNTTVNPDGSFSLSLPIDATYKVLVVKLCVLQGRVTQITGPRYDIEGEHVNEDGLVVVGSEDISGITLQLQSSLDCNP